MHFSLKGGCTAAAVALVVATAMLSASIAFAQTATGYSGVFGGGPIYKSGAAANIAELENSGFSEVIVWSVEVNSVGDLNLNGEFKLTSNGVYVGDQTYPDFAANMAQLKLGTVKRVTFSIGSSNYGDFQDITALIQAQGTGPSSILYKDFQALKTAIPALDAIDLDDENGYDLASTVQFGVMLGQLGYHVMPDPYTNASYWQQVVAQINAQASGTVDGVHLQTYAGGTGNSPCSGWSFGSVPVFPLMWDLYDKPVQVYRQMSSWHSQCAIVGGGMWLYDDFVGTGAAAKYAKAINKGVGL
jgi:carbon monoxide dehydrogenase subunit G